MPRFQLVVVIVCAAAIDSASHAAGRGSGDFNGDGYDDLVIAAPNSDPGGIDAGGSITVLYGTSAGLKSTGSQHWDQDSPGIRGAVETTDRFGSALAVGDFDGDGFDDLAIGIIGQSVNLTLEAGAVSVLYGSASGLTAAGDLVWHRDLAGMNGSAESLDQFGASLSAGDFDGDGFDDLAIGIPGATINTFAGAGAVCLLYGSPTGLTTAGTQLWNQDSPNILNSSLTSDFFGSALASGDFDGDGFDDLAIGVPMDSIGAALHNGAINVLYGSANGLKSSRNQYWHQDTTGIKDEAEDDDAFGTTLAAGDFDADGFDDLVVGIPFENINASDDAGAAAVLYGTARAFPPMAIGSFTRTRAGFRVTPSPLASSANPLPAPILMAMALMTWRSARPRRPSPAKSTPAWSLSCTEQQAVWETPALNRGAESLQASKAVLTSTTCLAMR